MQGVSVLLEEHVLFQYNTYQLVVLVIVQCGILYFSVCIRMQIAAICKYIFKYKHIDFCFLFLSLIVQNDSCIGKYVNFDDYNNVLTVIEKHYFIQTMYKAIVIYRLLYYMNLMLVLVHARTNRIVINYFGNTTIYNGSCVVQCHVIYTEANSHHNTPNTV